MCLVFTSDDQAAPNPPSQRWKEANDASYCGNQFINGYLWLGAIYCTMAFIKYGDWMCVLVTTKSS